VDPRPQEADGGWGGIQPPWVYSLIALHLRRLPAGPSGDRGRHRRAGRLLVREETGEGTSSPARGLPVAGLGHRARRDRAARRGVARDDRPCSGPPTGCWRGDPGTGDWAVRRPASSPGGWAFEFANDNYPDTDDTAEIVLALRRVAHPDPDASAPPSTAACLALGMQSRDGGWGAFDADNTRTLPTELPFCDFGEVIDPPSADVTAHIVEMLAALGLADRDPAARRALAAGPQERTAPGSAAGAPTTCTAPAPRARARRGRRRPGRAADPARGALARRTRTTTAVGRGPPLVPRSVLDGRGASTASQTRVGAAGTARRGEDAASRRARCALAATPSEPDGGWDEPQFTGTGFPGDFYINYHLYRIVFPVSALGRILAGDRDRRRVRPRCRRAPGPSAPGGRPCCVPAWARAAGGGRRPA
jgi:squalene-hopene/tetraprenyl-beta-curcumene cyclase